MDKADIIIEDGKIVQVGAELEVPSGMQKKNYLHFTSRAESCTHV